MSAMVTSTIIIDQDDNDDDDDEDDDFIDYVLADDGDHVERFIQYSRLGDCVFVL